MYGGSRTATGEYGHGAKAIERSGKEVVTSRAHAAGGQRFCSSFSGGRSGAANRVHVEGGIDALRAVPERGQPAQLDATQRASVRAAVLHVPRSMVLVPTVGTQARERGHRAPARRTF